MILCIENRLISAIILACLVILIVFLLSPFWFAVITMIVCMLAAWEWGQFSGFTSKFKRIWLVVFCGLLLSPILFIMSEYRLNTSYLPITCLLLLSILWWVIAVFLVIFYPNSAVIWRHSKILCLIFGFVTIIPFFWCMVMLRTLHYNTNHYTGALWLSYVMIIVWGVDSGAYIFGKLLGKHKLAPKISPEKTWQGLIGGVLTGAIIAYVYNIWANFEIDLLTIMTCSLLTILASVLGDLTESMFKREIGIKDSGYLIPGHGGILDRIDSLTAAIPIFTCSLTIAGI